MNSIDMMMKYQDGILMINTDLLPKDLYSNSADH